MYGPFRTTLIAAALLAAGGCAPFKKSTAAMFDRHKPTPTKTFAAAQGGTVAPLAIGQWSLYSSSTGPGVANIALELRVTNVSGFERLHVSDEKDGHLRVRQRNQNQYEKVFTAWWVPGRSQTYPVTVTIGNRTEVLDVRLPGAAWAGWGSCMGGFSGPSAAASCILPEGMATTDRPEGLPLFIRFVGVEVLKRFSADPNIPRVDVTVPAGTFHGAIQATFEPPLGVKIVNLKGPTTLWLHPAVPIDGIVKADVPGGANTHLELVDFGTKKKKKVASAD